MWKAEAKWENKCGKRRQIGMINMESRRKWDNKCGKQRQSGIINVECGGKVG